MVVHSVACVGRRFQSLIVRGKNESLVVAQVDFLKRCEPLVLVSFSCSTSVTPETSTIWWCILKIIISCEMYLLHSSDSQPKSCTIFVTQPWVLSVYAEWTNLAAFR